MPRKHCSLIAILWRTMACFFRCFGAKDADRRHLVSSSKSTLPTVVEPVASRNQKLSSLFQAEEREDAVVRERDSLVRRAVRSEYDDWELKDEAKLLKACGTLQETPDEIRKFSKKWKDSAEPDSELKFRSGLPNMSTRILLEKDKLSGHPPEPVRFEEEKATDPAAMDSPTPSSCIINEQSDVRISISSAEDEDVDSIVTTVNLQVNGNSDATDMSNSPWPAACKSEFQNRSVRFESKPVLFDSSPQSCIQNWEKPGLKSDDSLLKHSPYPTPLNLSDDMQTPGTIFASGNNARVRSQYVYTSINPSLDAPQNTNSESKTSPRETSTHEDLTVGTDLASWLKPPASRGAGNVMKYRPGRNQGDRPILGLVAEHWKEEEDVSRISPKQWDGKGIPNSTTKYKEDQKVNWHATPFEERLEKALSEESSISQRKSVMTEPVVFEDDEERDTATCKIQSLKSSKPLVSC